MLNVCLFTYIDNDDDVDNNIKDIFARNILLYQKITIE